MIWSEIAILVIVILGLALWLILNSARRLDRLHRKVVSSRLALDSQLLRRSSASYELASSGVLDPVSSVLLAETAQAVIGSSEEGDQELLVAVPDLSELVQAHRAASNGTPASARVVAQALDAGLGAEREARESALTAVVEEILDPAEQESDLYADGYSSQLLEQLAAAWYRVHIARRFHNESVLQAQRVRSKWWVRLFRLAGYAPMPQTVEFNDGWPQGLKQPSAHAQNGSGVHRG